MRNKISTNHIDLGPAVAATVTVVHFYREFRLRTEYHAVRQKTFYCYRFNQSRTIIFCTKDERK